MPAVPPLSTTGTTDIRTEYTHVEDAVLPDTTLKAATSGNLHQMSGDGETAHCETHAAEWVRVDSENALSFGAVPCRKCFAAVANYLADDPESPVERRNSADEDVSTTEPTDSVAADGGVAAIANTALTSRTEDVLVTTNGVSKTYHAPAGDEEPLCSTTGSFRLVDRTALAGHKDPCADCFEVEAIDTESP